MDDGSMAVGAAEIDGKTYVFDETEKKKALSERKTDGSCMTETGITQKTEKPMMDGWMEHTIYLMGKWQLI